MTDIDELLEFDIADGQVRGMICNSALLTQKCSDIHNCTSVCAAALGRLMTGTVMMGVMMKGKNESVTVSIKGNGPMGNIMAVAEHGNVKAFADRTDIELPLRNDNKLDVGSAIGKKGRICVAKDLGLKKDYVGQAELVSGEIAEDFANYFLMSEQQPSLVSLGVLVNGDNILSAGGLLLQPLPECDELVINQLELRSPMFADISRELSFAKPEQLLFDWFNGLNPRLLNRTRIQYRCGCCRHRMEKALLSIGYKELQSLIDENRDTEIVCHFCKTKYIFTVSELQELMHNAIT